MSEYLKQLAVQNAQQQLERREEKVQVPPDIIAYEAVEELLNNAKENGTVKSFEYSPKGHFLVKY